MVVITFFSMVLFYLNIDRVNDKFYNDNIIDSLSYYKAKSSFYEEEFKKNLNHTYRMQKICGVDNPDTVQFTWVEKVINPIDINNIKRTFRN